MIDYIGAVYANNETGLSWPIWSSIVCDENNDVIIRRDAVYVENNIKLS